MSRRTNGLPALARPRVMLRCDPQRRGQHRKPLILHAARALHAAGCRAEADAMRQRLRAAAAADHRAILREFVDFWPEALADAWPVGDPPRHWDGVPVPPERRDEDAA